MVLVILQKCNKVFLVIGHFNCHIVHGGIVKFLYLLCIDAKVNKGGNRESFAFVMVLLMVVVLLVAPQVEASGWWVRRTRRRGLRRPPRGDKERVNRRLQRVHAPHRPHIRIDSTTKGLAILVKAASVLLLL